MLFINFYNFGIIAHILQYFLKSFDAALTENKAVPFCNVGAFLDVGGNDTVSIAHCFEQTERHAFQVAWQYESVRIAEKFIAQFSVHKSGEYDSLIIGGCGFKFVKIFL